MESTDGETRAMLTQMARMLHSQVDPWKVSPFVVPTEGEATLREWSYAEDIISYRRVPCDHSQKKALFSTCMPLEPSESKLSQIDLCDTSNYEGEKDVRDNVNLVTYEQGDKCGTGTLETRARLSVTNKSQPIMTSQVEPGSLEDGPNPVGQWIGDQNQQGDGDSKSSESIMLVVECTKFETMKHILTDHSDYFKAMFSTAMRESRQKVIELEGMNADAVHTILDYCHKGELQISTERAHHLLHAAHVFQIGAVIEMCEHFLCQLVSRNNLIELLDIGDHYASPRILQTVFHHLRSNLVGYSLSGLTEQLKYDAVLALLECDLPMKATEFDLFLMVKKWVAHDIERRQTQADVLLGHIKFPLMSVRELQLVRQMTEVWLRENRTFEESLRWTMYYRNHIHEQPMKQTWHTVPRGSNKCILVLTEDDTILPVDNSLSCYVVDVSGNKLKSGNKCPFVQQDLKIKWSRDGYGVTVLNNFIYLVGGYDPEKDSNLASVYRFHSASRSWLRVQSMSHRRALFYLGVLDGLLYAVGGKQFDHLPDERHHTEDGKGQDYDHYQTFQARAKVLDSVECYNCTTDAWTSASPLPRGRYAHAGASCSGKLYISGGHLDCNNSTQSTDELLCYDDQSGSWSHCPVMHQCRYQHSMASVRGKLYVLGGTNYDRSAVMVTWKLLRDTECYDPVTKQWTILRPLPYRRTEVGATCVGDVIYIIGGRPSPGVASKEDVVEFDIERNETCVSRVLQFPTSWPTSCCIVNLPPDFTESSMSKSGTPLTGRASPLPRLRANTPPQ